MTNDESKHPASSVDVTGESIHWDLSNKSSYGGYLQLGKLLSAQQPKSEEHDEVMFIVAHQVSELWIKLALHELGGTLGCIRSGDLGPAFKMLSRTSRIQKQLVDTWSVMSTMTPVDYAQFRDSLGQASGFQSYQYRIMEYTLGNKNAAMAKVHRHDPEIHTEVLAALNAPSLYDETLRLLKRRDFDIPDSKLERAWAEPYQADPAVEAAWVEVYRDPTRHWDLYELGEKLVDVEDNFQQWRFHHMKTVSRIIGMKSGTGGTSGVAYLKKALDLRFFPELWSTRSQL